MEKFDYIWRKNFRLKQIMKTPTLVMLFSFLSIFSSCAGGFKDLSVEDFGKKLSEDGSVQLVDVRTADEFAAGHIPGAVNIDWFSTRFLDDPFPEKRSHHPEIWY